LLQQGASLPAVAIMSVSVANGCFNDDIRAHTNVPSVS
jgi:hypothetical protein